MVNMTRIGCSATLDKRLKTPELRCELIPEEGGRGKRYWPFIVTCTRLQLQVCFFSLTVNAALLPFFLVFAL